MNIIGHGIDIVDIHDFSKIIERSGERFEMQCFTTTERNLFEFNADRILHLAGLFAAKEAVLKALGHGLGNNISFLDIEIRQLSTGQPSVILYEKCKEIAAELGVTRWLLSISHTSSSAAASAIAVGNSLE